MLIHLLEPSRIEGEFMSETDDQVEGSSDADDQIGGSRDPKWEPTESEKQKSDEQLHDRDENENDVMTDEHLRSAG
jgi:hypothetical protein